jgi:hypothetical protein
MLIEIGNYSISTATKAFKHMILTTEQQRAAEAIRRFITRAVQRSIHPADKGESTMQQLDKTCGPV